MTAMKGRTWRPASSTIGARWKPCARTPFAGGPADHAWSGTADHALLGRRKRSTALPSASAPSVPEAVSAAGSVPFGGAGVDGVAEGPASGDTGGAGCADTMAEGPASGGAGATGCADGVSSTDGGDLGGGDA